MDFNRIIHKIIKMYLFIYLCVCLVAFFMYFIYCDRTDKNWQRNERGEWQDTERFLSRDLNTGQWRYMSAHCLQGYQCQLLFVCFKLSITLMQIYCTEQQAPAWSTWPVQLNYPVWLLLPWRRNTGLWNVSLALY